MPLRQPYLEIIRMDMIERPYKITGLAITDIWEQVMVSLNATGYTGRGKNEWVFTAGIVTGF